MKYGTPDWFEEQFVPLNRHLGDRWGHRWRGSQKLRFEAAVNMLREVVKGQNYQKILDVGCGMGDFTKILFNLNKTNRITAIDISANALKNFIPHLRAKVKLVREALPFISFPDSTFDGIVALEVLYYLNEGERELSFKNLYRILKPKGWLFFTSVVEKEQTHYFTMEGAITLFQKYFDIKSVGFHHAAVLSQIERIPFAAFNKMVELKRRLKNNVIVPFITASAALIYFVLSQKWIAASIIETSKLIFGSENTRSHIMLLGIKK